MAYFHSSANKWLLSNTDKKPIKINTTKKYRFKQLDELKKQLDESKSKLDDEYKKYKFSVFWANCDPFKYEKQTVAMIGCTLNVSNAWVKCFELVRSFELVENIKINKDFLHFDNAAFPGSFIVATHHLIDTLFKDFAYKYQWRGSCLLNANEQNTNPLEDKYKLYANYKNNWLMSENNNGDVLNEDNQLDFYKQLHGKVDLYTSDLGFDVSADYNNQEKIQHQANIGQILSGLLTLKKGGCFITKQYTTMEPTTIAIMYAAASFFDEFYLCKPFTSRMANSETYLIGKGFKYDADTIETCILTANPDAPTDPDTSKTSKTTSSKATKTKKRDSINKHSNDNNDIINHPYIKAMFDKITGRKHIDIPIFDANQYPDKFIKKIIEATEELTELQISKLDLDIIRCNKCINGRFNGKPRDDPIINEFYDSVESKIAEWYKLNPILPITNKLDMVDALYQEKTK